MFISVRILYCMRHVFPMSPCCEVLWMFAVLSLRKHRAKDTAKKWQPTSSSVSHHQLVRGFRALPLAFSTPDGSSGQNNYSPKWAEISWSCFSYLPRGNERLKRMKWWDSGKLEWHHDKSARKNVTKSIRKRKRKKHFFKCANGDFCLGSTFYGVK